MNATVVVAGMGFVATFVGAWLTARWQRRAGVEGRLLDARIRVFGECAGALYEYERASYNRVRARLDRDPDEGRREELRQVSHRSNAAARTMLAQVSILSPNDRLHADLERVREAIGELNRSADDADLRRRHESIAEQLEQALRLARSELTP